MNWYFTLQNRTRNPLGLHPSTVRAVRAPSDPRRLSAAPSCGSKLKGPSQRSKGLEGSQISKATSPHRDDSDWKKKTNHVSRAACYIYIYRVTEHLSHGSLSTGSISWYRGRLEMDGTFF